MLSVADFDAMINEMGQSVAWRRAYDCPCRDEHSGAANPSCPSCAGKGVTWGTAAIGIVGVSGQKVQQQWAKLGMYESGDQVLTLPSDSPVYQAGNQDRMVMFDSTVPFSRVLIHSGTEKLALNVASIARVFWLNGAGVAVEGGIPTVSADGTLDWVSGTPPVGTQYSVTGRRHPEYYVFQEFPQDRSHYGGTPLPRRVVVRLMDLFGR